MPTGASKAKKKIIEASANTPTDTEIVQRVKAGDTEAFGLAVARYTEPIYNLIRRIVRDDARAEDLTQETFVSAYEHLDRFRGDSALATWLYRIAYNRAVGACRRKRILMRLLPRHEGVADEPPVAAYDEETVGRMRRALERLAAEERALVALFYEEELTVARIAEITGYSEGNVKVKLHRVRNRIRQYMER